jgi:NADH:ubiquinone oxidoreductase subunit F (NADH-binding)
MANPFRNELETQLGSTTYTLRASFEAIAQIENHLDKSLGEVLLDMSQGKTRISQIKAIVQCASTKDVDEAQLEQDLMDAGINAAIQAVGPFLGQAFKGTPVPKKAEPKLTIKK